MAEKSESGTPSCVTLSATLFPSFLLVSDFCLPHSRPAAAAYTISLPAQLWCGKCTAAALRGDNWSVGNLKSEISNLRSQISNMRSEICDRESETYVKCQS